MHTYSVGDVRFMVYVLKTKYLKCDQILKIMLHLYYLNNIDLSIKLYL